MRHMLDILLLPECLPLEMIGFDVHVLMEALQCASGAAVVAGPVTIPSSCCIVCDSSSAREDAGYIIRNGPFKCMLVLSRGIEHGVDRRIISG
ncbi:hypothetical protein IG631_05941 [Alternaria alternata]|nr:hypothetical protein IG631_05941 [Alternaria alternata]